MKVIYAEGFQGRVPVPPGVQCHGQGWQVRKTLAGGKKVSFFVSHAKAGGQPSISLALAVYLLGLANGLTEEERDVLSQWMNTYKGRADFKRASRVSLPDNIVSFRDAELCSALKMVH